MVLVAEHDEVDGQLLGALDDDAGDVVLGRLDQLAVDVDAGRGQPVNGVLDDLPFPGVDVDRVDTELRAGGDVAGAEVPAGDVQQVHRGAGHRRELGRPGERVIRGVRGRVDRHQHAVVHR